MSTYELPEINYRRLGWTLTKQLAKIGEEYGEVCQAVAEGDPVNTIREALDVIQTMDTLIRMTMAETGIRNLDRFLNEHREKLLRKGCLRGVEVNVD